MKMKKKENHQIKIQINYGTDHIGLFVWSRKKSSYTLYRSNNGNLSSTDKFRHSINRWI